MDDSIIKVCKKCHLLGFIKFTELTPEVEYVNEKSDMLAAAVHFLMPKIRDLHLACTQGNTQQPCYIFEQL